MGALLFLYVGAEFGLGAWVSSYARETADAGVFEAALLTAGYWFALMCGRLISALYFSRGHESSLLLAAAIAGAGLAAVVLAVTSGNIVLSAAAAFVTGLCLGPVWPATLAIASHGSRPNATATTVTMGNAGGLLIPWLQGKVLVGAGPTQGIVVTSVLCAVMFAIVMVFRGRERAAANDPGPRG
jgi:fucose permease